MKGNVDFMRKFGRGNSLTFVLMRQHVNFDTNHMVFCDPDLSTSLTDSHKIQLSVVITIQQSSTFFKEEKF